MSDIVTTYAEVRRLAEEMVVTQHCVGLDWVNVSSDPDAGLHAIFAELLAAVYTLDRARTFSPHTRQSALELLANHGYAAVTEEGGAAAEELTDPADVTNWSAVQEYALERGFKVRRA